MFGSDTWLSNFWDRLSTSFWFLPTAMACGAILLSFGFVQFDDHIGNRLIHHIGWFYEFGPESARATLSAIAGSMITVAGLTFSMTMLTLQLASSQYGPRLLRNFMQDRGNQVVLGTFIATFIYCLLVLGTVRGTSTEGFVPQSAVMVGMLLAVASLGVLIYFIHHIATSIHIESLLNGLAVEARGTIDRLYPDAWTDQPESGSVEHSGSLPADFDDRAGGIPARQGGYVRFIDIASLHQLANKHGILLHVNTMPGAFVTKGSVMLRAYPDALLDESIKEALCETMIIGQDRTPEQDIAFTLRRIVEIAQRALSPGINDPTTALYCLDRLGEALELLATREPSARHRYDDAGQLSMVMEIPAFRDMACPMFTSIARYALKDAEVMSRLLQEMQRVADAARPACRTAILELREGFRRDGIDLADLDRDRATLRSLRQAR